MTRLSSGLAVIAVLLALVGTARADTGLEQVELTILNQDTSTIRCVVVLAHFVSHDVPVIVPGARATLSMMRDPGDGSLSLDRHDGRRMMVENVLCGRASDWTATRSDVPMLALRAEGVLVWETACRVRDRLVCTQPAPLVTK